MYLFVVSPVCWIVGVVCKWLDWYNSSGPSLKDRFTDMEWLGKSSDTDYVFSFGGGHSSN